MTTTHSAVDQFLTAFNIFEQSLNSGKEQPLHAIRKKAIRQFSEKGFPGRKDEEWRFTNVLDQLNKQSLTQASIRNISELRDHVKNALLTNWKGAQLVLVDGVYQAELSEFPAPPKGLSIQPISTNTDPEWLVDTMNASLANEMDAFSLLNSAFFTNGLLIETAPNFEDDFALHILSVNTMPGFRMHKNMISVAKNSRLTLLESFVSTDEAAYFSNVSTHIDLAENSRLDYYKLQDESPQALHISNLTVQQNADSVFRSQAIDLGGSMVRNNLTTNLNGSGAETTLNGLYLGTGTQHIDNHTVIEHVMPHCNSYELYQGILAEESRGVFSGMIHVHPDAQKTDAKQSNNCLLLSDKAKIDSKPQLEIYADDVACTHGATVGQLNDEEIFYLRSRGISEESARHILTYAFAEKIIQHIAIDTLNERVEELFRQKLAKELQL